MIGAVSFEINDEIVAKIYPFGKYNEINWGVKELCELGMDYNVYRFKQEENPKRKYFTIAKSSTDVSILRLFETKRYIVKIETKFRQKVQLPRFQNEENKFLKLDRDETSVIFQFINYLGRSKMIFEIDDLIRPLCFEVVPDKMDYEDDYIKMTEALADVCSELLLEYSGTTSNLYSQNEEDSKLLMEQFIFLRKFCYSQNLQSLFETIKRNPDRKLISNETFRPIGSGIPSNKFYVNPFSYGRGWQAVGVSESGRTVYSPQEVAVTEKYDSLDTSVNRFVKYALTKFDEICQNLIMTLTESENSVKQAECVREAQLIHRMISDIGKDCFFDDIGELDAIPQNNQVLQKREGYAQIFVAYSMIDLALQLDWKGKKEVYEGESKNVALLYEYWLFFELFKIVKSIEGSELVVNSETPFLENTNDGVRISLEQDKKSCQSFILRKYGVKVNLYYNRTFSYKEFKTTKYEGSYSRPFRPDYTIAIFPEQYHGTLNGEENAIKDGEVSYIHFDAKYRITDLTAFVGNDENGKSMDEEEELAKDKTESVTNTYHRGDLLKMHTYNDAIRRTIGSYVLYPGTGMISSADNGTFFRMYDEILPGVGAFAIKPSNAEQSEKELKCFLIKLIAAKSRNASRLNRLMSYTEAVLREPSIKSLDLRKDVQESNLFENHSCCIIGYIRNDTRNDYYVSLKDNNLLKNGARFLFYFYAIRGQRVYSHHKDITRTEYFRFYTNDISKEGKYEIQPVLCMVENNELISKAELVTRLTKQGYQTKEENHHADFYYVLTVKVVDDHYVSTSIPIHKVNAQNGNDTFSPHSPKIVQMSE